MATNRRLSDEEKAARKAARKKTSRAALKKAANAVIRRNNDELDRLAFKPKRGDRKHNWDEIREFYVSAPEQLTMNVLADHFKVPPMSLKQKASAERWTQLRAIEQARRFRELRDDRYKRNYEEGVKFDDMSVNVAKMGMGVVAGRLSQMARFFRASEPGIMNMIERMERGEHVPLKELKAGGLDSYELLRLAQAATMFQDIGRKGLGTDGEQIDINVGGAVEVEHVVNIGAELAKGDIDRLTGVVEVLDRLGIATVDIPELEGIQDAEVVEDEEG